jgi:hypothetical protein
VAHGAVRVGHLARRLAKSDVLVDDHRDDVVPPDTQPDDGAADEGGVGLDEGVGSGPSDELVRLKSGQRAANDVEYRCLVGEQGAAIGRIAQVVGPDAQRRLTGEPGAQCVQHDVEPRRGDNA